MHFFVLQFTIQNIFDMCKEHSNTWGKGIHRTVSSINTLIEFSLFLIFCDKNINGKKSCILSPYGHKKVSHS